MKFILTLLLLLTSRVALAHEDHLLGDGIFHLSYHLIFWTLLAGAVYKGLSLCINAKKKANNN